MNTNLLQRTALALVGLALMGYGLWPQEAIQPVAPGANTTASHTATRTPTPESAASLVKIPIKDMRVGTRVPAFNPEVSAAERRQFTEPNWYRWMKLKLEMPKPDGTMLEIEMLRSEDWIIQQLALIVEPETIILVDRMAEDAANGVSTTTRTENSGFASTDSADASDSPTASAWVPLRPIYFHLADLLTDAASDGNRVLGMVVELDLPELGLTGPAWVVDLEPAPIIPVGPGQVVTATFKHASASVLDLVLTSTPPATLLASPSKLSDTPSTLSTSPADLDPTTESIGVTANHPFWSVDRAEFVQAGELMIGERLQTLSGDTKWVQQKLPRPGPVPVYNLEVHAEHVYYVGTGGVLAHNSQNYAPTRIAYYSRQSRNHVYSHGHAANAPRINGKSRFRVTEGGQKFVDEVINNTRVRIKFQGNGRLMFEVDDLGRITGWDRFGNPVRGGRVVMEGPSPMSWSTYFPGEVVTMFPK